MSTATPTTNHPAKFATFGIAIDADKIRQEIAANWGWMLAGGILAIAGGTAALLAPVFATGIAGTFIAATLLIVGCVNLTGVFFAQPGLKLDSFLTGVVQVLLAGVMAFYPFASLMSLTILIAAFMMADGLVRIALAIRNRELPGWAWTLGGGLAAVATGVIVLIALPASSLWVIGILVGVSLLCSGVTRVAIAMEGRKLAKEL